jgi:hypothetical protein
MGLIINHLSQQEKTRRDGEFATGFSTLEKLHEINQ